MRTLKLLKIGLFIGMVGHINACSHDLNVTLHEANSLLYAQKYAHADKLYRKLRDKLDAQKPTPNNQAMRLLVLTRLGQINGSYLHDYPQSLADHKTLVRQFTGNPQAHEQVHAALLSIADINHHKLADLPQAIETYQRLIDDFGDHASTPQVYLNMISAQLSLRQYELARITAHHLMDRYPNTNDALQAEFSIADAYALENQFAQAAQSYETLLDKKPDSYIAALALFELGNCYQEMGDSPRALTYYYACLALHPTPLLVQQKIARIRARLHQSMPRASILNATRPKTAKEQNRSIR